MATSSRQAGFLLPTNDISMDDALEDSLNPTIAGITGFDPDFQVRPRYQVNPPTVPDRTVNWVAFGINRTISDTQAATVQKDQVTAQVIRTTEIEVLMFWYGPNAGSYADVFRDGMQIDQNRDQLRVNDFGVIDIGEARKAPELFKQKFLTRYDMTLRLRRRTVREYAVSLLLSVGVDLHTDPQGETPIHIDITPPSP